MISNMLLTIVIIIASSISSFIIIRALFWVLSVIEAIDSKRNKERGIAKIITEYNETVRLAEQGKCPMPPPLDQILKMFE